MDVPTFVWMFVILKVPIIAALLLIWYAVQAPEPSADDGDGGSRVQLDPDPRPTSPRRPRRGPHATPPAPAPDRIRTTPSRRSRRPAGR